MIQLKDIAHLYLGCGVVVTDIDGQVFEDKLEAVKETKQGRMFSIYEFGDCPFEDHEEYYQGIKLKLRHLSSMTEEEARRMGVWVEWHDAVLFALGWENQAYRPDQTAALLKEGFDLFGLIESGQAIDSTQLETSKP